MRLHPVLLRPVAEQDVDEAAEYYAEQGGLTLELGFLCALDKAFAHIARHPASGSARYAELLRIYDLRFWPLKNFPYLVFYIAQDDRVNVWRVLHGERDIPAFLREEKL